MANPIIYTVTMPSGNTYDLVDQGARDLIKELMNFREWLGVTTSEIDEGSSTNPILIGTTEVTAVAGDVVSRDSDHKDFIFSSTGVWQNFGELSGLGALAFKDSASGTYTPQGTISAPTFTGTTIESTGSYTPKGLISAPEFTGESMTSTGSYTPKGLISAPEFTGASMTSTGSYTPSGSISEVAIGTTEVAAVKSVGTLPTCTMPTFTVSNGNLTITDGSYVAGTLPESEAVTVASGTVTSQPTFTGTTADISVVGTTAGSVGAPTFTGTTEDISVVGTTTGSVGALTFTGTTEDISVVGTTAGTVGTSTFTGVEATITVE